MGALQKVVVPQSKEAVCVTDAAPSVLPLQQLCTLTLVCKGFGVREYRNALVCHELQSLLNLRDKLGFVLSGSLKEELRHPV